MAQNWDDNTYALNDVAADNLQQIEDNFAAVKSSFSGSSTPANAVPGMFWFDTTNKVLKVRNQADSAWLGIMTGNSSVKVWVYSNTAGDGWVIDTGAPTDRVLALKGGSQAYNEDGGTQFGTWTQPSAALLVEHLPSHDHGGTTGNSLAPHTHGFSGTTPLYGASGIDGSYGSYLSGADKSSAANLGIASANADHSHSVSSEGSGSGHNHGTTYRPYAAIGTLQYPYYA